MSEPFLAEIKIVGFNFAPRGWAFCDGQILPINQNQSLFSLIGTTFGGDGRTTFGLPELRGRTPVGPGGEGVMYGTKSGEESVTLTVQQIPAHSHNVPINSEDLANSPNPLAANSVLGKAGLDLYAPPGTLVDMTPAAIGEAGGSQPHTNMQPFLAVNFCIALQGLFPSRN